MNRTSPIGRACRPGAVLALLLAPVAGIEQAEAACTPASPVNNTAVTCTGTTTNQNGPTGYGTATDNGNTITVQPGASVTGTTNGLLFNTGTVNNSGAIAGGVAFAIVANATANSIANVTNSGTIAGSVFGIAATTANVVNSGTISGSSEGIHTSNTTVTNSGLIAGTGATGIGINSFNAGVTNSGAISGGAYGISGDVSATVTNSGTIAGTGTAGVGIAAAAGNVTNSGTIIGAGGTAIRFSGGGADTLTLLPGSRIVGAIDMGGGADQVNFTAGRDIAWLVTLNNFAGTIAGSGGAPHVQTATQIATLDPTAYAMADRTLMDFSGGVSSLVHDRLGAMVPAGGGAPGGAGGPAIGFAPARSSVADAATAAFAGMPSVAMAYAPDSAMFAKAPPLDPATTVIWTNAFGGQHIQDAQDVLFRSTSTAWGGVIGIDRRIGPDLLLGAFVGGGAGRLSVDQSSQTVDTDYLFGGLYGRFDRVSHFLDFTVQGGGTSNRSTRLVANNLAPGGLESASASYNGWYVSPELAFGVRLPVSTGVTLTPTARLRYLAGQFAGYSEAGSAQNLVVGSRTVEDIEERFELVLSHLHPVGYGLLKTSATLGVLGLERIGDTTVNTVLIGQNLAFATPGRDAVAGVYAGLALDHRMSERVGLFGAVEGAVLSDRSRTGTAKGGLRVAF